MDQASLLDAAIRYMGYLQQRLRMMEEQATAESRKTTVEDDSGGTVLPDVRARICNKTILVKIQCGKRKGLLVDLLGELDKLHLAVVNLSVAPFASLAYDITVIAKMEKELSFSTTDVVTALGSAIS